MLDQGFPYNES